MTRPPVDLTGPQATWPAAALRLWREATDRVVAGPDSWHPSPVRGDPDLRAMLGDILGENPDDILVTNGVRAGAALIAHGASRLRHERPSFTGTVAALRSFRPNVELLTWQQLSTMAAEPAEPASLVWLTSPSRNPDGASLGAVDLDWVRALSRTHRVVVNEIYRWFGRPFRRPARAWAVGSLSKMAGGGAGLGWIRGPGVGELAERQYSRPSPVWQRSWCHLLEHGALDLFTDHTVRPAQAASEAFTTELRRVAGGFGLPPSGANPPFLLLPVPTATAAEFVDRLDGAGIRVGSGEDFLADAPAIRVCFVGVTEANARRAGREIGAELTAGRSAPVGS